MIKTRLVGLLSHAKKYIVYTILWQWAALLSQVLAVFSIADLLERVVYRAVTVPIIERTILILVLVVVIRFICERMGARSSYLACVDVKRILREKIYEKMLKLGASYSEQVSSSEVVQVVAEGVEQLETYFGKYLPQLFYSLIAPLTLFIILCRVSLKASVILLICVPLIPISIVVVQKIAKKLLNKYWNIYTGLGDSFLENLQGLTTLKIYQADQQKADEMDVESQNFRRITMKVLTMQLNSTSVMDIVAYGGAAVGMAVAVSEFLKGNLTVSGTLCIVLLASEFFLPLRLLGSFFHIAMNGMAASDKIFKILDLPEPQCNRCPHLHVAAAHAAHAGQQLFTLLTDRKPPLVFLLRRFIVRRNSCNIIIHILKKACLVHLTKQAFFTDPGISVHQTPPEPNLFSSQISSGFYGFPILRRYEAHCTPEW